MKDYCTYSFWLETAGEPLRWLAVRYAQKAFLRIDEAAENDRACPLDAPVAEFLRKH